VAAVAFIGDELTATGFRLAGARVWIVPPEETVEALRAAREEASLVLISPAHAQQVPGDELEAASRAFDPLVLVVDDVLEREAPPDVEQAMRSALGVEAA
jgi:vacuolar-type H+-ATPase subunit F/Vma7